MEIEHGIPLPRENRGRTAKYPFLAMKTGDSIFIAQDDAGDDLTKRRMNLVMNANGMAKRNGMKMKFTARVVDGGVRVWRIS